MTMSVPVLRTWMRAVAEISRAVNVADPLDVILTRVADLACELIGFDFCAVMLADGTSERMEVVGWSGLSEDYVEQLRDDRSLRIQPATPEADSPAARAFRETVTVSVSDVRRHTGEYGRLALASTQGYSSLVASPLRGSESTIGVLVGYSVTPRNYGTADIELSELLAEQTATAIHTARLRARREWAEQQHHKLMQLVLEEVGLDGLVETLSEVLGASVAVIDTEGKLLAAAGDADCTSLPKELPRSRSAADREPSYATQHVDRDGSDAWVTSVMIGGKVAARLWVLGDQAVSDPTRRRLVEQFALVVGIEMLTVRHTLEIEERLSGDLLSDVLRGESLSRPQVLLERGNAIGFDLESARHVVLVCADGITDQRPAVARQVRHAVHQQVLATSYGDDVVLLVSDVRDLIERLHRVRQQLVGRTAAPVTMVVSPPIRCLDDIRSAYQAAGGAARLRTNADGDGLVDLRHLSVLGLLLMADSPSGYLRRLADQLIAPVAAQDERRDGQLLATLRAWLGSGFSVSRTAEALTVHVNTVGQRLARVEKLTARDLRLADTRLDLQLALHVWDIVQLKSP